MNDLLISILVPIYNVEKYLKRCLVSLFEQDYHNLEYIFVNDCSTDNSIHIFNEVIQMYPERKKQISLINNSKNQGSAYTRNLGILKSSGAFLLFVDSDDAIKTDMVSTLCKVAIEQNADVVSCDQISIETPSGYNYLNIKVLNKKDYLCKILHGLLPCCIWGKLIKRNLFTDNNIHAEPGLNHGEDLQVMIPIYYYAQKIATGRTTYFYNKMNVSSYTNCVKTNGILSMHRSHEIIINFLRLHSDLFSDKILQESLLIHKASLFSIANLSDYPLISKFDRDISLWKQNIKLSYKLVLTLTNLGFYRITYIFIRLYLHIK